MPLQTLLSSCIAFLLCYGLQLPCGVWDKLVRLWSCLAHTVNLPFILKKTPCGITSLQFIGKTLHITPFLCHAKLRKKGGEPWRTRAKNAWRTWATPQYYNTSAKLSINCSQTVVRNVETWHHPLVFPYNSLQFGGNCANKFAIGRRIIFVHNWVAKNAVQFNQTSVAMAIQNGVANCPLNVGVRRAKHFGNLGINVLVQPCSVVVATAFQQNCVLQIFATNKFALESHKFQQIVYVLFQISFVNCHGSNLPWLVW